MIERIKDRGRALVLEKGGMVAVVVGDLGIDARGELVLRITSSGFFLEKGRHAGLVDRSGALKALTVISGSASVYVYRSTDAGVTPVSVVSVQVV